MRVVYSILVPSIFSETGLGFPAVGTDGGWNHFFPPPAVEVTLLWKSAGHICKNGLAFFPCKCYEFSFIFVQNIKANVNIIKQNVGLMNNAKLGPCFGSDLLQISNLS